MELSVPINSPHFQLAITALTAIAPDEALDVALSLSATSDIHLERLSWELPDVLSLAEADGLELPLHLSRGRSWSSRQRFRPSGNEEGFGEIRGSLSYLPEGGSTLQSVAWKQWISIYSRESADEREPLSDELRQRLIEVVNAHERNGHIFLSDHISFFKDYLNILIPEQLARLLSRDFGLADEELPVDPELYQLFRLGQRSFFGIDKLELIAEEYCNESDDRFDPEALQETIHPDVGLL